MTLPTAFDAWISKSALLGCGAPPRRAHEAVYVRTRGVRALSCRARRTLHADTPWYVVRAILSPHARRPQSPKPIGCGNRSCAIAEFIGEGGDVRVARPRRFARIVYVYLYITFCSV